MSANLLKKWFPETTSPFICNAPMYGTANANLAAAVSRAGGFGFIGGGYDFSSTSGQISALDSNLRTARQLLSSLDESSPLPLGVGFITFHPSASQLVQNLTAVLTRHKPCAIWLFAPSVPENSEPNVHASAIPGLQALGKDWGMKVFVQVGTVEAAREACLQGADVIVGQGIDAGGHQWAQGASILSLIPEIRALLRKDFPERNILLVAAGGIVNGSGLAAALALGELYGQNKGEGEQTFVNPVFRLGADGIIMGTRFIVADESPTSEDMKDLILSTTDGAKSTVKSTIHDDMQGTGFWPGLYDGRAIIGKAFNDHISGAPLEKIAAEYKEALQAGDNSWRTVWAGSGIGLIDERMPAGQIVKTTQEEAKRIIKALMMG